MLQRDFLITRLHSVEMRIAGFESRAMDRPLDDWERTALRKLRRDQEDIERQLRSVV